MTNFELENTETYELIARQKRLKLKLRKIYSLIRIEKIHTIIYDIQVELQARKAYYVKQDS